MSAAVDPRLARLAAELGLDGDPAALLGEVRAVYAEIDAELARGSAGVDLPCKPGCDACCHEAVFVSAPELLMVADALFGWPAESRRRVVDEMLDIAARFEDELELLETIEPGPERDEVARRVAFRCPLLGRDGRCSVYAARELNARTFGQSIDERRGEPYGCELTHARLRVLPEAGPRLFGARAARRRLADRVPGTERVHVYPWWFARHRAALTAPPG